MKSLALLVPALISLSMLAACKNPFKANFSDDFCWTENTKKTEHAVIVDNIQPFLIESTKRVFESHNEAFGDKQIEFIKKLLTVKVSDNFIKSISVDNNSIVCGAVITISLTDPHSKIDSLSISHPTTFNIYRSENNGALFTVQDEDLVRLKTLINESVTQSQF